MEIFFWNGDVRGKIPGIFFLNTVEIMIILITWTSFLYSQCFSVCREKWIVFSANFLSRSNNVMETFMMIIFFQMTSCNILSGYFIRVKLSKLACLPVDFKWQNDAERHQGKTKLQKILDIWSEIDLSLPSKCKE